MKTRIIQDDREPTESLALEGPEAAPHEPDDRAVHRLRRALTDRPRTPQSGSGGVDHEHGHNNPKP